MPLHTVVRRSNSCDRHKRTWEALRHCRAAKSSCCRAEASADMPMATVEVACNNAARIDVRRRGKRPFGDGLSTQFIIGFKV